MKTPADPLPSTSIPGPWAPHLAALRRALVDGRPGVAARHWEEARLAALGDAGWQGLLTTGQARLALASLDLDRATSIAAARRLYFAALFRASHLGAPEGVAAAALAFAGLGDRDVLEECLTLLSLMPGGQHTCARLRHDLAATEPGP